MRFSIALLALAALVAAAPNTRPANLGRDLTKTTGRLIVTLKKGSNLSLRQFDRQLKADIAKDTSAGPGENVLVHQYTTAVRGYSGVFSKSMEAKFRANPELLVEQDTIGYVDDIDVPRTLTQDNPPSWGQSRISNRVLDLKKGYVYSANAGEGVEVYVIDTGIDTNHTEFAGRARFGKNFITTEPDNDGYGHGTHCAGTIGGSTYGLAKKAKLVAVKACTKAGSCTTSDVTAAIEYVIKNGKKGKTVVNISLGLAPTQAIDDAVQAAVDAGIAIICPGGNADGDSCQNSPRRAPAAFAVGATANTDNMADFSNWGKCLKTFAPGVDIISAKPGGGSQPMSGTSMASPHVAGVAALYLADKEYASIPDLHQDLIARSTPNAVKNLRHADSTVNRLAYSRLFDSEDAQPVPQ